ncbi:MAG: S8 family serine peptidase [Acidobacteriota bacterium]
MRVRLSALGACAGRGVRVGIIDSGVHADHPHVQHVAGGVGITATGGEHPDFVDRLGHGTAVTAVIREKAPEAELWAIKVFDRSLDTTGDALVAALGWASRRGLHLVNLSLGTANPAHATRLADAIEGAAMAGTLVVAAGPQDETRWLPGSLPGVVAVVLDSTLPRDECEVAIGEHLQIHIRACGYPRPIPGVPPERNLRGLSFAVANATGFLARVGEGVPEGGGLQGWGRALRSVSPSG